MTLQQLLASALTSDLYEEEAEDFLEAHNIPITSHDRTCLYKLAWRNGWRPKAA